MEHSAYVGEIFVRKLWGEWHGENSNKIEIEYFKKPE
jgi:hypothetical protein